MQNFVKLVREKEEWLSKRILKYAVERGYSKYGPTLEEVWRLSVRGLSESMLCQYELDSSPPEFNPDDDLTNDPVNNYAIEEARKHRKRGTTLAMFLGLLKYFRQGYFDLVEEHYADENKRELLKYITRSFDRYEIGFCAEWSSINEKSMVEELQSTNRNIINEKNTYLTVFESITDPVILLNINYDIVNLNFAASQLISKEIKKNDSWLEKSENSKISKNIFELLPWLDNLKKVDVSDAFKKNTIEASANIDGTEHYFEVILSKMLDVSEKYTEYILTIRDITDQKFYVNSLKQKSLLVDSLHDAVVVTDMDGKIKEWNKGSEEIFGYTFDEVINKAINVFSENKKAIELSKVVVTEVLEKGYWKGDFDFIRRDGKQMYIESTTVKLVNDKNQIVGILGVHRDVSELKKSEQQLLSIIENTESSIWLINSKYELIKYNTRFKDECKIRFGLDLRVSLNMVEAFHPVVPESANIWKLRYERALSGESFSIVDEFDFGSGKISYIKFQLRPIKEGDKIVGASVFSETITEQKLAEKALIKSEEEYRTLFETMAQGVVYQDNEGKIINANTAAERILGLSLDQLKGRTSIDERWHTIHEDGTQLSGNEHPAMIALNSGKKISNRIMGIYNPIEDNYRWISVNAVPQFHPGDTKPYQVFATFEDITNIKLAEIALKQSEQKFRTLFLNMNEGFALHKFILDKNGEPTNYMFIDVNPAFEKMTGVKKSDITGKLVTEVLSHIELDSADWIHKYAKVAFENEVDFFEEFSEFLNKWFLVNAFSPNKGYFATIFSDITERKLAEQKLQKFAETQETLLREVNHRVKNNLAALLGILHKEEEKAMVLGIEEITPIIKDISNRVQGLSTVHTMLSASGWRPLVLEELCKKIINGTIKSLEHNKDVELSINESHVRINSSQAHHLTLVLNELATNSVKYIDNPFTKLRITILIEENDNNIKLTYKDNGPGYPKEIIDGNHGFFNIGFQLINGIAKQSLAGQVEVYNDNGAVTKISFDHEDC